MATATLTWLPRGNRVVAISEGLPRVLYAIYNLPRELTAIRRKICFVTHSVGTRRRIRLPRISQWITSTLAYRYVYYTSNTNFIYLENYELFCVFLICIFWSIFLKIWSSIKWWRFNFATSYKIWWFPSTSSFMSSHILYTFLTLLR
jgi:hypothetical protein